MTATRSARYVAGRTDSRKICNRETVLQRLQDGGSLYRQDWEGFKPDYFCTAPPGDTYLFDQVYRTTGEKLIAWGVVERCAKKDTIIGEKPAEAYILHPEGVSRIPPKGQRKS